LLANPERPCRQRREPLCFQASVRCGTTKEEYVMAVTQLDKGISFRALHQGTRAFVIPNAWDAGSARVLTGLGFSAIATSSYATAGTYGTRDGRITRDQVLA